MRAIAARENLPSARDNLFHAFPDLRSDLQTRRSSGNRGDRGSASSAALDNRRD